VEHGIKDPGPDGRTPREVLVELAVRIRAFLKAQYDCWREDLVPGLVAESVRIVATRALRPAARAHIENFYAKAVEPLLTPVTIDPAHPFPHVINKAICLAFLLRPKRRGSPPYLGVVTVPRALPRLVQLPSANGTVEYVFLSDVIHAFAERLYHGYEVLSAAAFRVTRNSNLYLEAEELSRLSTALRRQACRSNSSCAVLAPCAPAFAASAAAFE
jgi:polyphosphate kinase